MFWKDQKKWQQNRRKQDITSRVSDKEMLAKLCWNYGNSENEKYYKYAILLLIQTGAHLTDLLQVTISEAETEEFYEKYPDCDVELIKWFIKQSQKHNSKWLLYKRHRNSYSTHFRKKRPGNRGGKGPKQIVPMLKRR
jgi:hypothetical protein